MSLICWPCSIPTLLLFSENIIWFTSSIEFLDLHNIILTISWTIWQYIIRCNMIAHTTSSLRLMHISSYLCNVLMLVKDRPKATSEFHVRRWIRSSWTLECKETEDKSLTMELCRIGNKTQFGIPRIHKFGCGHFKWRVDSSCASSSCSFKTNQSLQVIQTLHRLINHFATKCQNILIQRVYTYHIYIFMNMENLCKDLRHTHPWICMKIYINI